MELFRPATSEEERTFTNLMDTQDSIFEKFKKSVEQAEAEHVKKRKPFCARCARFDFKDMVENKIKEVERKEGWPDFQKVKLDTLDLTTYGDKERFNLVRESDAMEPVSMSISAERKIKIGIHRDYKCKIRNCGISIFVPNDELEKEKKK